MPLQTISKLLGASSELKGLRAGARRLQALQSLYAEAAPRELVDASRVKTLKAGTLVVTADNAAIAAKLRQLTARLLTAIQKSEAEVTSIRIEVQVSGAWHERVPPSQKVPLSEAALQKFSELSRHMPQSGLKRAIGELVKRHSKRGTVKR